MSRHRALDLLHHTDSVHILLTGDTTGAVPMDMHCSNEGVTLALRALAD